MPRRSRLPRHPLSALHICPCCASGIHFRLPPSARLLCLHPRRGCLHCTHSFLGPTPTRRQVDEESSIRANTTVLLGNIATYLGESTCRRVLPNAFTRALKDAFPPARIAGLRALSATKQYYPAGGCRVWLGRPRDGQAVGGTSWLLSLAVSGSVGGSWARRVGALPTHATLSYCRNPVTQSPCRPAAVACTGGVRGVVPPFPLRGVSPHTSSTRS